MANLPTAFPGTRFDEIGLAVQRVLPSHCFAALYRERVRRAIAELARQQAPARKRRG